MTYRLSKAALLIALPLASIPAFAQIEPEPAPAPAEETAQEEKVKEKAKEKKICKRLATSMSSRRTTRVCKTRAGWQAYNEENRGRPH